MCYYSNISKIRWIKKLRMLVRNSLPALNRRRSEERVSIKFLLTKVTGTQRRNKKKTHTQTQVTEDKKLKSAIKKFGK